MTHRGLPTTETSLSLQLRFNQAVLDFTQTQREINAELAADMTELRRGVQRDVADTETSS